MQAARKGRLCFPTNSVVDIFSEKLMTEAAKRGWNIVSMQYDWKRAFAFAR
jgi:hypothetical protein